MKFLAPCILAIALVFASVGNADACDRQPVRNTVRAVVRIVVCTPVRVARAVDRVRPVRRAATLPFRTARYLRDQKPVRCAVYRAFNR